MLRLAVALVVMPPLAMFAPVVAIAQETGVRPSQADVQMALLSLSNGQPHPLFTPGFAQRVAANSQRLAQALGQQLGYISVARALGQDQYMGYYSQGFVHWQLEFTREGRISGATYEIRSTPGTRGVSVGTRDQTGLTSFWAGVGEVVTAYQQQRAEEEAFNSAVLARIHASGGYASTGSGVGARGEIISDADLASYEQQASSDRSSESSSYGGSSYADAGAADGYGGGPESGGQGRSLGGSDTEYESAFSGQAASGGSSAYASNAASSNGSGGGSYGNDSEQGAIIVSDGGMAERLRFEADQQALFAAQEAQIRQQQAIAQADHDAAVARDAADAAADRAAYEASDCYRDKETSCVSPQ
ncbi:hypothetical protein [Alteraurantiacibacter buctensis]|uniref:Uncharacterized protein n=1 Tax=Alteraurantiacibacter buctensis TaxID=1503981 RepID=A0A844YT37_9SPHN|nr:hypothetical protein [Alteraurantiacibacter buctensis]MXO70709.1 hypothetical protein [Alteraurantiacibacter buctensis]